MAWYTYSVIRGGDKGSLGDPGDWGIPIGNFLKLKSLTLGFPKPEAKATCMCCVSCFFCFKGLNQTPSPCSFAVFKQVET